MTLQELSEITTRRRVLVTGGAGSVGIEVLKELYEHKTWYEVTVLDRNSPEVLKKLKPFRNSFRLVLGNIYDPAIVRHALSGADFVIHLAAVIPPLADRKPELAERVNIEGTKTLVRLMEEMTPGAFLLYTSSVSVYGDRVYNPWITVEDPLVPSTGDYYAETKIAAERLVRNSRLRWSVFRLSAVLDPGSRLDPLFFHMPLNTSLEMVTTRDTGFALVESMYHQDQIRGKIFNLSGGPDCRTSYRSFLDQVFSIKGLRKQDLPERAFAERNFHCGYFMDSDRLNDILHFQRDSLDTFYNLIRAGESWYSRVLLPIMHKPVKRLLARKSEPFRALKSGRPDQIHRFYYSDSER